MNTKSLAYIKDADYLISSLQQPCEIETHINLGFTDEDIEVRGVKKLAKVTHG